MSNLVYLKQKGNRFSMSFRKEDSLHFEMGGLRYEKVKLVRTFPYSFLDQYISVRSETGEELMLISNLNVLDDASRAVVQEELKQLYMVPVIEQILSIRKQNAYYTWEVQTDFGRVTFTTENAHEHIHSIAPDRWIITDMDARKFLLADLGKLDAASKRYWQQIN
ncbi:DUF1854 domain-containing protein [Paenibacillus rhizovicinus]|uniref:DUF1854 domain-containing protein n=1 Tax=Paenibacillus rhizovicinus TaxID=2704463 RepID=A0A6C0NXC3_9BACL|nr:DUF1854 domain-containing protein [Paenibacillus rhizovicinus]QHW30849.1 DUF1854 domain-containing protein [Paenibacillus rhizovicinus]